MTVVPLAFTLFGAYHYEFKHFLDIMSRIAIATDSHFPLVDGSFTNILFIIASFNFTKASEAVRGHHLGLQPLLVLLERVLHAQHVGCK